MFYYPSKKLISLSLACLLFFIWPIPFASASNYKIGMTFLDGSNNPITTAQDLRISLWDSYDVRSEDIDANGNINTDATHYASYQTTLTITPDGNGYFVPITYGYYKLNTQNLSGFPDPIGTTNSFLQLEYKNAGDPNTSYQTYDFVDDPPWQNITRYQLTEFYGTFDAGPQSNNNTFTLDANNNATTEIKLEFGEILAKSLTYNKTNNWFSLNDDLRVGGDLRLTGSNFIFETVDPTGWYNGSWTYRKKITVDNTKVSADLTNFPLLVKLTSDADLSGKAQADGDDILFTSSDGTTKLKHEIEKIDSSTGQLIAWVKIPSLSSTVDTIIYMYYGNASAVNQQDAINVWDTNYKGVFHLSEDPSGTAPQMLDSTANNLDGTSNGTMTVNDQLSGKIDGSLDFDGSNDYISTGLNDDSYAGSDVTISAWLKLDSLSPSNNTLIVARQESSPKKNIQVGMQTSNQFMFSTYSSCGSSSSGLLSPSALETNKWYHVVFVLDSGISKKIYVDGSEVASDTTQPNTIPSGCGQTTSIGANVRNPTTTNWDGILDEVRISNVNRSAAWISTEYNNHNSPSTFYSVDLESTGGGGSSEANIGTDNNSSLKFFTNNTTRLTIDGTGNVGIGTVNPQSPFHIPDGSYAQFEDNNAGPPPAADCDSDTERGRQSIDTTNNRLYLCNGATRGWDYVNLTD